MTRHAQAGLFDLPLFLAAPPAPAPVASPQPIAPTLYSEDPAAWSYIPPFLRHGSSERAAAIASGRAIREAKAQAAAPVAPPADPRATLKTNADAVQAAIDGGATDHAALRTATGLCESDLAAAIAKLRERKRLAGLRQKTKPESKR